MPDVPGPDDAPASPPPPPPSYPGGYTPPGFPGAYPPPAYGASSSRPPAPSYASYGPRVVGWIIDWVITSIIGSIALLPFHAVHQVSGAARGSGPQPILGLAVTDQGALLFVLIVMIYTTAFIGSHRGQTLGMMVVRARAVDAATGAPIGYGRALGRVVFEYVMLALLFVPWVIDMLFPLWDARRQTLHDKVTNTVVIKT